MVVMPVVALFYMENGLLASDIFVLKAVYSLCTGAMEIPSGYCADVWGRKKTLIAGSVLGTLGFGVYVASYSFGGFVLAEMMLGIGQSFISGADSALLYDSLKVAGKEHSFLKHEGRITAAGNYAETLALIVGGAIASYFVVRTAYFVQFFVMALSIPAALLVVEPSRNIPLAKHSIRNVVGVAKYSLVKNGIIGSSVVFSSVIGLATLTMAWGAQAYLAELGCSGLEITSVLVALNFTVAGVALFPHKVVSAITPKNALLVIAVGIPLGFFVVGVAPPYVAIGTLFLFYAIRGVATPVLKDYVNKDCGSEYRATILSLRSLIIRIGFAGVGVAISVVSKKYDIHVAFLIAFGIFFCCSLLALRWFSNARR